MDQLEQSVLHANNSDEFVQLKNQIANLIQNVESKLSSCVIFAEKRKLQTENQQLKRLYEIISNKESDSKLNVKCVQV